MTINLNYGFVQGYVNGVFEKKTGAVNLLIGFRDDYMKDGELFKNSQSVFVSFSPNSPSTKYIKEYIKEGNFVTIRYKLRSYKTGDDGKTALDISGIEIWGAPMGTNAGNEDSAPKKQAKSSSTNSSGKSKPSKNIWDDDEEWDDEDEE